MMRGARRATEEIGMVPLLARTKATGYRNGGSMGTGDVEKPPRKTKRRRMPQPASGSCREKGEPTGDVEQRRRRRRDHHIKKVQAPTERMYTHGRE